MRRLWAAIGLFAKVSIIVAHTGMLADALYGFVCGQFSREEALHAPTHDERMLVLQVQAYQYEMLGINQAVHESNCGFGRGGVDWQDRRLHEYSFNRRRP